jgi:uncharacterized protein (TIGR03435 family)
MKNWMLCIATVLLLCGLSFGQQTAGNLQFEVASIKPSEPQPMGRIRIGMSTDQGMLRYTNVSVQDMIRVAYRVKDFQIDGPDWLNGSRFDVTAKFPAGATEDQVPEMLQTLLADRFKLLLHRGTKERPIYALLAAKDGPKLKAAEVQTSAPGGGGQRRGMGITMDSGGLHLEAQSATVSQVSELLARFTERPIVDMTGIQGQYEFDLVFTPEKMPNVARTMPPPGGDTGGNSQAEQAPSVFDAVQKYGLRLDARKGPIEMLTIDHVEKTPTEN